MSDTFLGWYFAQPDGRLANGDGRRIVLGETHKVTGWPVLCAHGLHASPTVLDALQYAQSAILYRVSLSGGIVHGDDKSCATERAYLARLDAADVLRKFARECALSVVGLWDAPNVVREFLTTGDESCRAAAWDAAAPVAASAAAWGGAWGGAWASHKHRLEQMALDAINEVRP